MPRSRSRGRRRTYADVRSCRTRERRRSPSVRPRRRKRHRPRAALSEPDGAASDSCSKSPSEAKKRARNDDGSKWVCATCGGPHRTRECPVSGGGASGSMNPAQMGMMMGMPGMPAMGMPGMPLMGMPGIPGMPPAGAERTAAGKDGDGSSSSNSSSSGTEEGAPSRAPRAPRAARKQRKPVAKDEQPVAKVEKRELVCIEEVEKFMTDNRINEEAALKVRALSPASQRRVIARQLTGDVQDPSKVMIARVRAQQSQNEAAKASPQGSEMWMAWNNAMMGGASVEAVNKYIEDKQLDEGASQQLRSLPPQQQSIALRWDLSGYKNPSAKFMSMANTLGSAPKMGMPGMPGMPMMGMPPMMMMGMHPGMPPMGMHAGMPPMGMPPGMRPMGMHPGMGMPPAMPSMGKPAVPSDGGINASDL